jgi:hypothetical protein
VTTDVNQGKYSERDLNPGTPKHEAGLLVIQPRPLAIYDSMGMLRTPRGKQKQRVHSGHQLLVSPRGYSTVRFPIESN